MHSICVTFLARPFGSYLVFGAYFTSFSEAEKINVSDISGTLLVQT